MEARTIIEIWNRFNRPGVMLWEDSGDGFKPMTIDGKFVCFSDVATATDWLLQ